MLDSMDSHAGVARKAWGRVCPLGARRDLAYQMGVKFSARDCILLPLGHLHDCVWLPMILESDLFGFYGLL